MTSVRRESTLALGHYLTLRRKPQYQSDVDNLSFITSSDGFSEIRFQNFWISQNAIWQDPELQVRQVHAFSPFGFSGISVNRSGDNVDARLVFPNNEVTRSFSDAAIREQWTAVVRVCWVQNLEDPEDSPTLLHRYEGQVSSAVWEDTTVTLVLNSILDAVQAQVPARSLQQLLVGNVPFTGQLSLR